MKSYAFRWGRLILQHVTPDWLKRASMHAAYASMSPPVRDATTARWQIASMDWSLRNLKRAGFAPRLVVDLGAASGTWTQAAGNIFTEADFLMIEARPEQREMLEAVCHANPERFSFVSALLGADIKPEIAFTQMSTGSSVFEERSDIPREYLRLPMTTLDAVLASREIDSADFLKLDVQGYEIEILRGAPKALDTAEVVLMEVSLLPINRGAPLFHETIAFMKRSGFVAFDICSFVRRPQDHFLWQIDMLFVKEDSAILGDTTWSVQAGA